MTTEPDDNLTGEQDLTRLSQQAAKIGKLGTIYSMGQSMPRVLGVVLLPIFTHYLVPAQMGIASLAMRTSAPLVVLAQLGLWNAMKARYFHTEPEQRSDLVRTVLLGQLVQAAVICLALTIVGVFAAGTLLPNLPLNDKYVFALWMMVVWGAFPGTMVQLVITLSELTERAVTAAKITVSRYLLQAGLSVMAVAWWGWEGFGRYGMVFAASAVAGIISFVVLWNYGKGKFHFSLFKSVLRVGLTFVPHSFSGMLVLTLNAWLLNREADSAALGIFSVASVLPQMMYSPLRSIVMAAYPTFANLMLVGTDAARRQQSRLYTMVVTANLVGALGMAMFGPNAVRILTTNPQYHQGAPLVPILMLAWLCLGLSTLSSQAVEFAGRGLWLSTATIISLGVNVIMCLLLVPDHGMYGAAWSLVGCFFARFVVVTILSSAIYRLPWQLSRIFRALACVAIVAFVDLQYASDPTAAMAWSLVVKTALFSTLLPLMWISGAVTTRELVQVKEMVSRVLAKRMGRSE